MMTAFLEKPQGQQQEKEQRLHFLDTLRVIAIVILVLYHIGMIYVPEWEYHFKNELEEAWLQPLLLLSSPWRMGLLWIISGCALAFALARVSGGKALGLFAIRRTNQLILPLLIGVLFVVPVQLYVEMKQAEALPLSFSGFIYAFYFAPKNYFVEFSSGIWPRFDVNHLWFLRSLWQFTLMLILVSPIVQSRVATRVSSYFCKNIFSHLAILLLFTSFVELYFEGEAVREAYGFCLLLFGFCFAKQPAFWSLLQRNIKLLCMLTIISMLSLQVCFSLIWQSGLYESGFQQYNEGLKLLAELVYVVNKVLPILAILALGQHYLNKPSKCIRVCNGYVFPLYVLHQSVLICNAYIASNTGIEILIEAKYQIYVNLLLSPLICLALLMIIRKFEVLRVMFGMRLKSGQNPYNKNTILWLVFLICLPLSIRILT